MAAVQALFRVDPGRALRLFVADARAAEVKPLTRAMAIARRPFRIVPEAELERVAGTPLHGGICAVAEPRVVRPIDPSGLAEARLALLLDAIGNPHNLGAIARSAAFFGVRDLLLSDDPRQALPSDAAYRIAEGGLEHLALWQAPLPHSIEALRPRFRIVASLADGGLPPSLVPRDRPILLLLGNEEVGLAPGLARLADTVVTIPGSGRVQSLNVSVAAAILLDRLAGA